MDSGASVWVIDSELSTELGLERGEAASVEGAGGETESRWCRASQVRVGPVTFPNPRFLEIDLSGIFATLGVDVGGICGYDLFEQCVVEMDMDRPSLRLHDPAAFELPESPPGRWEPLILNGRLLCVEAVFEGHKGLFRIDTGAGSGTVLFHSPAVRMFDLLDGRDLEEGMSEETVGTMHYRVGRLRSFEFGGREFDSLLVGFSTDDAGAMADSTMTGTVMRDLLLPFNIVFDVGRQRIAFIQRS
jgi:hypothetical protein